MAYFISGFKTDSVAIDAFDHMFRDILPDHESHGRARLTKNASAYIINYNADKVIPNIEISSDSLGSWLVLLGTPLVNLKSEEQKQQLLSEFLENPTDSLCHRIDGNFSAFCFDAARDRFIVATDYNNTTPVFYSITPDGAFFSSHELALARFLGPDINPAGFFQSINLGVTWGSYTRFQNISKTLPCQIIVLDNNKNLHAEHYWRPQDEHTWSFSFDLLIEKWLGILKESIWKYFECSGQRPVISDFTAGEDGRLILSLCHSLGIPFTAQVRGSNDSTDVLVARRAANEIGFDLIVRPMHYLTTEQLLTDATKVSLHGDAYKEFTISCIDVATEKEAPLDDYSIVKYCGVPGGEAFRGAYYLRGKAFFPSKRTNLDYRFFTRMKYLLDYYPGLLRCSDHDGIETIFDMARSNLDDVKGFPIGIQIDHMLRVFQTCFEGLKYKNPLYLPFATNRMTRSLYSIPPGYKRGGKLTKACTEILYPELAIIRTQKGVPTIRKTLLRQPLFFPEYVSLMKGISSGAVSRLFKWRRGNKWYYDQTRNMYVFTALLNSRPYSDWLSSTTNMETGFLYNPNILNPILAKAKAGSCRFLPLLGRIVNQELACRWVYS